MLKPYQKEDYKIIQKLYEESIRYRPDIFYMRIQKFVFGSGPIRLAGLETDEEIQANKIKAYSLEQAKECCKICGVHLEEEEINSKMRCTVCYFKVDDR